MVNLQELKPTEKIDFLKHLFNFDRAKEFELIAFGALCKFSKPDITKFEILTRFIETDNLN